MPARGAFLHERQNLSEVRQETIASFDCCQTRIAGSLSPVGVRAKVKVADASAAKRAMQTEAQLERSCTEV